MPNTQTPIPEMLGRQDVDGGTWDVRDCLPVRGEPMTNIIDRVMKTPNDDTELGRVIRAHEMMHARVSPHDGMERWATRGVATVTGLMTTEEVRVNILCERAGFNVRKVLTDGSEVASGERLAEAGDWAAAVYTAVAYANSGGLNPFLVGVRRHKPEWSKPLRAVADKVVKEFRKVDPQLLASTVPDPNSGLTPFGYCHTERIAELVDRIANPPQPEGDDENMPGNGDGTTDEPPVNEEAVKQMQTSGGKRPVRWPDLRIAKMPLDRNAPGGLGKKRRAANMGRNPRRVHRMITDPDRRIFDAKKPGNGGVVLIDGSASVDFSTQDITRILEAAPGATIAVYSAADFEQPENLWVLAERGRMCTTLPERRQANGIDYPALVWAIEQRRNASEPVVWITDGYVHPPRGGSDGGYGAILMCMKAAINGKVLMRPDIDSAVNLLRDLARGRTKSPWWPVPWREIYWRTQNRRLRSVRIPD